MILLQCAVVKNSVFLQIQFKTVLRMAITLFLNKFFDISFVMRR